MPDANVYTEISDFMNKNPLIAKVIKEEGIHFMGTPVDLAQNVGFASKSELQTRMAEKKSASNHTVNNTKKL